MIHFDNIAKQNGHQILFTSVSAALFKGEKVVLVGPNGSGKSTLFRMIIGEDQPDEGKVSIEHGVTIGYSSQDVGEMADRSAVMALMDGVGPVSVVAAQLPELEARMADPNRAKDVEALIEAYGLTPSRFEQLGGYVLEGRAREVLAGLSFSQEMMDCNVGSLSCAWKMRVALARILLMRSDVMLLDEPSPPRSAEPACRAVSSCPSTGYDEPQSLSYAISSICPIGPDGEHCIGTHRASAMRSVNLSI